MQINLWNLKSIDSPPYVRLEYSYANERETIKKLNLLQNQIKNLIDTFKNDEKAFKLEMNLLDKIIYKNWNALRKEKTLNLMKKLQKLIGNFDSLNLTKLLSNFDYENVNQKFYYPTKEIYEYTLLRLYSALSLLNYSTNLCINLYKFIGSSLRRSVFTPNNIIFLSITSRIYVLLNRFKNEISNSYELIRENITIPKSTNLKWNEGFNIDDLPSTKKSTMNEINESIISAFPASTLQEIIYNENDFGTKIERDEIKDEIEEVQNQDKVSKTEKWIKILIKKFDQVLISNENKKKNANQLKKIRIFFKKKLAKLGKPYAEFLCINKELLKEKFKKRKKFLDKILNLINSYLN